MNLWIKRALWITAGLAATGGVAYSYVPKPVRVETDVAARGPLVVEVDAAGQTRVKRRYTVTAPIAGVVSRPEQRPGDPVKAGDALVTLHPIDPPLLDARARAQAEAQIKVAIAARAQAEAQVDLARTSLSGARTDSERQKALAQSASGMAADLDSADLKARTGEEQLAAARMGVQAARFQEEAARALVQRLDTVNADAGVALRSPADGRILRVLHQDGGVVQAGTAILEIGDPADLEIVLDLLSTNAVNVRPAAGVTVERWGGPRPLAAAVRNVEPAGTTKVSALGIEEQRVNVIADFTEPLATRATLGDGYRVEARVVVADLRDVLRVPLAALFRSGDDWAVFTVARQPRGAQAALTRVTLGQRSERWAEVRSGLADGARVVLHPGNRLRDGIAVEPHATPSTNPPIANPPGSASP